MAFPAGLTVQIEFGTLYSGVWTNVTTDVDTSSQISMRFGRTSPQSQAQVAGLTLRLSNALGKYTPGRQVLADGVTAHPYYPNVVPDKRIQVGWTIAAVFYPRYTGFIYSWVPGLENGVRSYVDIVATDITDRLSRVVLQSTMLQEELVDTGLLYTMGDAVGSTSAAEYSGGAPLTVATTAPVFGANGPGAGDGTAATFTNTQSLVGAWFAPAFTWKLNVYLTALPSSGTAYIICDPFSFGFGINSAGILVGPSGSTTVPLALNQWHQLALSFDGVNTALIYIDGQAPFAQISAKTFSTRVYLGDQNAAAGAGLVMSIGHVKLTVGMLPGARVATYLSASQGYYGDTTGQRITRMLTFAGLTSAQWNLDTGQAVVNSYPQGGKSVLQYCQDMATTEGGGSVFYSTPDGKVRFADRTFRTPGAPAVTIDAQKDLLGSSYSPSLDKSSLVNQVVVSRSAESGTLTTQTVTVPTTFGLVSQPLTTYTTTDADALDNAEDITATSSTPGFRLPKIGIALLTAVNNLYVAVAGTQIGSRLRLTNIPAGKAPATQLDVILEGWTETFTNTSYNWEADASPADNPPRGVYSDTTYGIYGAGGACSLTSTVNAAVTSLSITTSAGNRTFSTSSGDYPMDIQINEEAITLNTVPGGSTSPQAFTGVTRGALGTPAATQTAGSLVDVYPAPTYAL